MSTTSIEPYQRVRDGVFLSDLHLFSPRSAAESIRDVCTEFQQEDQCIILGGDIFDFRWSVKGGFEKTITAAQDWLLDLIGAAGDAQVVFLPGNHDCHPAFLKQMDLIAENEPRFTWHEHFVQIGACLFLHGDILDAGLCERQLVSYRKKFHHADPQHKMLHRCYDMAVALRVHKLVPSLRHRPVRTCSQLTRAITRINSIDIQRVQYVFFGHTHVPIHGIEHGGVKFYNPGAALKHMMFHTHKFSATDNV